MCPDGSMRRKSRCSQDCFRLCFSFHIKAVVPYKAQTGKGSRLGHRGVGVVVHPDAVIGENVLIGSGVTVGGRKTGETAPKIGNNVYIGNGAKILGSVIMGDNCVVGANAVVIKSVPARCVVAGVPARILRENIDSFDVTTW